MNKLHVLDGYKTFLVALAIGVASAVHYLGWIDTQAYLLIIGILAPTGLATLRQGIKK